MSLAKIGNKIFDKKVELSKEEVELGKIDDVKLDAELLEVGVKSKIGDYLEVKKSLDKIRNDIDGLKNRTKDAEANLKEVKSIAKTLGLEVKDISASEKSINKSKAAIKKLEGDVK